MKKIFDEKGFINKDGVMATLRFKEEIYNILETASSTDCPIIGSILHKIVGDMVFDHIQSKKEEQNKFAAMSDFEFEEYLVDKYIPIYGKNWVLKAPLTDEEGERSIQTFRKGMDEDLENVKKRPREQHYGLRLSPRHVTKIKNGISPYDASKGPLFPDKYKK